MTARRLRWAAWPVAAVLVAAVPAAAAATPAGTTVTVNVKGGLATCRPPAWESTTRSGTARWGAPARPDLLKAAGVGTMRYPGGSYGDIYHWQNNTAPGGYVAPNTDFDTFMGTVQRSVPSRSSSPTTAPERRRRRRHWVRYANVTKGYGVKYWEIGNEVYGNGHYGSDWETDNHADKSPTAYANGVVAFADAMKAVDPTIKIGAVLTTPGELAGRARRAGRHGDLEPDGAVDRRFEDRLRRCALVSRRQHGRGRADQATADRGRGIPAPSADQPVCGCERRTSGSPHRDECRGRPGHPTGRPVRSRTPTAASFSTASSRSTGGICTTARTASTVAGQTDYGDGGMLSSAGCPRTERSASRPSTHPSRRTTACR